MSERAFASGGIVGFRAFGWQVDYRRDGWLPLSVRHGWNRWHVLRLGRFGCLTAAPMVKAAPIPEGFCELTAPHGSHVKWGSLPYYCVGRDENGHVGADILDAEELPTPEVPARRRGRPGETEPDTRGYMGGV